MTPSQENRAYEKHSGGSMSVPLRCCKCERVTKKFVCPHCSHRICTSCKEPKRWSAVP
jgi:hypothetical protein